MIDRLICFILTLFISTATIKHIFSAIKYIKTILFNKIKKEFLVDCIMIYIEQEFVEDIDLNSIIDKFYSTKYRSKI